MFYCAMFCGFNFLLFAFMDWIGVKALVSKRFREYPCLRKWQRKRAVASIVASAGSWLLFFAGENKPLIAAGLVLVILALVVMFVLYIKLCLSPAE